ncbi:MAG: S41 family peptidase [Armatimonadetes bacterium]|nr:S41 family peptidase [Armatimonadota bacterium]
MPIGRRGLKWVAATAVIAVVFSAGYWVGQGARSSVEAASDPHTEGRLLLQAVVTAVGRDYLERNIDWSKLYDAAAKGMLQALDDPYTAFFTSQGFKKFQEDFQGFFYGIGIFVDKRSNRLTVVSPIKGTPADRAGLLPGDYIAQVDGVRTDSIPLEEAIARIRGKAGTTVRLQVVRPGRPPFDVSIVRARINVATVQGPEILKDDEKALLKQSNLGYIRIVTFNNDTYALFAKALGEVETAGARGLVLDLRFNPGGLVNQCTRVADHFVPNGPIIHEVDRNGRRDTVQSTSRAKYTRPVVVLINEGTASCSEILAGAVEDTKVGVLVGQKTFGKGVITSVVRLPGERGATITTAKYLTPAGRDIHRKGIEPNVAAGDRLEGKVTERVLEIQSEQLRKAVEVLKSRIR